MTAINRFHEVANDALVKISEHLWPEAKIALTIYTPGEPGKDIVLKDQGIDLNEVLSTLRRSGLSIDGDNSYKRDLLDSVVGALAFGKQNTNHPPKGHWGQRFWDIGRAEGELQGTTVAMPAGLHPDTQDLVTRFATALAVKLHAAELKHGYSDGWKEPHWMDECRYKLIEHLAKGDPRDVAAYCAFLWHHCQSTSPSPSAERWTYVSDGLPAAPLFDSLEVIVAVQRAHNGKVYVFTTDYLNRYPIIRMDQTVQDDDNASDEITGWYYLSDDEETWHRTLADGDQVIAWQLKPAAPEVPEQVQP